MKNKLEAAMVYLRAVSFTFQLEFNSKNPLESALGCLRAISLNLFENRLESALRMLAKLFQFH